MKLPNLPYLFLTATVLLTAAGHLLFKYFSFSFNFKKPYQAFFRQFISPAFAAGFIFMASAPLFYFKALESLELSIAYSFTALNQIAVPLLGIVIFREKADSVKISGIILIAAGIAVWNL